MKLLSRLPTGEIVFLRACAQIVLTYAALMKLRIDPWKSNVRLLLLRGFFGTLSLVFYTYTLLQMPFANAVTLSYLTPLFTVLVAWIALREKPAPVHWLLMAISFAGVILVRGFDSRVPLLAIGAGVVGSACAAIAYTFVRQLRDDAHPLVVVFFFPLVTIAMVGPFASGWVLPHGREWPILGVFGVFTLGAQYYMTRAYQGAPPSKISNLNYLGAIYAILIGWIFFDETVAPAALGGLALIIGSSIASVRLARQASHKPD